MIFLIPVLWHCLLGVLPPFVGHVHDYFDFWIKPASCFLDIIFIQFHNLWEDMILFHISTENNSVAIVLVGIRKGDDQFAYPMKYHNLVSLCCYC